MQVPPAVAEAGDDVASAQRARDNLLATISHLRPGGATALSLEYHRDGQCDLQSSMKVAGSSHNDSLRNINENMLPV